MLSQACFTACFDAVAVPAAPQPCVGFSTVPPAYPQSFNTRHIASRRFAPSRRSVRNEADTHSRARFQRVQGLAPEIPEDLYFLIKKAVSMRKHLDRFRKDRDTKFRLILVESRIHRLARYYKVCCAFYSCAVCESLTHLQSMYRVSRTQVIGTLVCCAAAMHASVCIVDRLAAQCCNCARFTQYPVTVHLAACGPRCLLRSRVAAGLTRACLTRWSVVQQNKKLPPNWKYESATASTLVS